MVLGMSILAPTVMSSRAAAKNACIVREEDKTVQGKSALYLSNYGIYFYTKNKCQERGIIEFEKRSKGSFCYSFAYMNPQTSYNLERFGQSLDGCILSVQGIANRREQQACNTKISHVIVFYQDGKINIGLLVQWDIVAHMPSRVACVYIRGPNRKIWLEGRNEDGQGGEKHNI